MTAMPPTSGDPVATVFTLLEEFKREVREDLQDLTKTLSEKVVSKEVYEAEKKAAMILHEREIEGAKALHEAEKTAAAALHQTEMAAVRGEISSVRTFLNRVGMGVGTLSASALSAWLYSVFAHHH